MFIISDRVKETSTTSGSGSILLNGAYGAFQTFLDGIGDGSTTYYTIENNTRWEVGQGTYDAATNSLSRDIIFNSSQSDQKINLQGTSVVFCTLPAEKAFIKDPNSSVSANDIVSSGQANLSSITTNSIYVSGDSNFKGDTNVGGDHLVSGDLSVLGNSDLKNVSGEFLTLVRPNSAGNFLHAYKDDGTNQTVSLWVDSNTSPLWRFGLKNNPSSTTASPTFGYIFGRDGSVGSVSNTNNYFSIADTLGFSVFHDGNLVFRASSDTGVYINGKSALYPAFTIQGAPLNLEDLQRWEDYTGTVLSVIDSGGKVGILTDSPIYDLDVNGSGRLESIYLTSGIYFQDGTFQSTAQDGGAAVQDIEAVSGIAVYASGLSDQNTVDILAVSGIVGDSDVAIFASGLAVQNEIDIATVSGLLYDDTAISGYFESRADTNENQIIAVSGWAGSYADAGDAAVSGWAQAYVDSQDHSATAVSGWAASYADAGDAAVSGWAQAYVDGQDHSATAVSGWAGSYADAGDAAVSGWTDSTMTSRDNAVSGWAGSYADAGDAAVSGWAQAYVDSQDHSATAVSGWVDGTFLTSSSVEFTYISGIAVYASGLAGTGGGDVTTEQLQYVSGIAVYASGQVDQNSSDIITVSGLLYDDSSISGYIDLQDAAVSGWVQAYVDGQDHSATAVSGWAGSYADAGDAAVSGWADNTFNLQEVTDRGSNTTNSIFTSGNITATSGYFDTFDMTPLGNGSQPPHLEGRLFYDSDNHTLSLYNDEADVTLQLGQEEFLRVRNNTGATITNGAAVLITGAHGSAAPTISGAIATSESSAQVVGLATHDIEDSSFGYVTTYGIVRNVDTSQYSDGDEIFLSATQIGSGVNVSPTIPNYKVTIGHVIRSHGSNGSVLVQIGNPKLGGGDLKSEAALNMSGVPFVTSISDTAAGGSQTDPLFVFDSGNRQLQVGSGIQLLDGVPSNTSNVLYNSGGSLYFNGSGVSGGGGGSYTAGSGLTLDGTEFNVYGGSGHFRDLVIENDDAANVPLSVAAASGQTANIFEVTDGDGDQAVRIEDDGKVIITKPGVTSSKTPQEQFRVVDSTANAYGCVIAIENTQSNDAATRISAKQDGGGFKLSNNIYHAVSTNHDYSARWGVEIDSSNSATGPNSSLSIHAKPDGTSTYSEGIKVDWTDTAGLTRLHVYDVDSSGLQRVMNNGSLLQLNGVDVGVELDSSSSAATPLIVRGAASQSANLQEWQDSSEVVKAYIDSDGSISSKSLNAIYNQGIFWRFGSNQVGNIKVDSSTMQFFVNTTRSFSLFGSGPVIGNGQSLQFSTSSTPTAFSTEDLSISRAEAGVLRVSRHDTGQLGDIMVSGVMASGHVQLAENTPADTTNKLYNSGGSLYFNGSAVGGGGSYTAGSGLTLAGTEFNVHGGSGHFIDLKLETSGTGDLLTLTSTEDGSDAAPVISTMRDSASPADGDYLGQLKFKGRSDTGTERVYAKITGKTLDVTNGAEDGLIEFAVRADGSQEIISRIRNDGLRIVNDNNLYIQDNGSLGVRVDPTYSLHVKDDAYIGSGVTLPDVVPAVTTNKLYNNGGTLTFNGSAVGGGGGSPTAGSGITVDASDAIHVFGGTGNFVAIQIQDGEPTSTTDTIYRKDPSGIFFQDNQVRLDNLPDNREVFATSADGNLHSENITFNIGVGGSTRYYSIGKDTLAQSTYTGTGILFDTDGEEVQISVAFSTSNNNAGTLYLEYSTDNGSNWTTGNSVSTEVPGGTSPVSFTLDGSQSFHLRLKHVDTDSAGGDFVYINSITVDLSDVPSVPNEKSQIKNIFDDVIFKESGVWAGNVVASGDRILAKTTSPAGGTSSEWILDRVVGWEPSFYSVELPQDAATTTTNSVYNSGGSLYFNGSAVGGSRRSIQFVSDGGGSVLTTGVKSYVTVPYDCTVQSWTILAENSGSVVVDVWKDTYANYPPTVADTIAGTEKPTISSGIKNQDNSLTTWTTALSEGDILAFNIDSVTDITKFSLSIDVEVT